jgi:hypothetical protein
MAHKVILPPQKNYIPQFLKQRDINSYYSIAPDYWGLKEIGLDSTLSSFLWIFRIFKQKEMSIFSNNVT